MQVSRFNRKELVGLAVLGLHSHLATVVGRITVLQKDPHPNPQTCAYIILPEKGLVDVIKVNILRCGDNSELSGWDQPLQAFLQVEKGGRRVRAREGEVRSKGQAWLLAFKMEGGRE